MNVPIKFRGIDFSGKVHYGNYAEVDGCHYIIENTAWHSVKKYRIKPDSVAQLVNYDDDGKELYENDTVVDKNDDEYRVCFERIAFGRFCALKFDDEIEYRGLLRLKTNDD